MYGVCRSTCLAIWALHRCLGLALYSWVIVKGHQLGLSLLVCIPGGYCTVLIWVDILLPAGQSSGDPCSNGGWHDLWILGQGFWFLWANVTSSGVLSWFLRTLSCIWDSFAWWSWIFGNGIPLVIMVLVFLCCLCMWLVDPAGTRWHLCRFVRRLLWVWIVRKDLVWQVLVHEWWHGWFCFGLLAVLVPIQRGHLCLSSMW